MSYDFEYMIADYDEDELVIQIGHRYYTYSLSAEMVLFEGGKANGVEYEQIGYPEDTEDTDEYKWTWDDEEGWVDWDNDPDTEHTSYGRKSIRRTRW